MIIAEMIFQLVMVSNFSYSEIYNMPVDKRQWLYRRTVKWLEDKRKAEEDAYNRK